MPTYEELIELGLDGGEPLKIILKGYMENGVGVVALVFASLDKAKAKAELERLTNLGNPEVYYMVYSVPFDTDLTKLDHFPSIAISKEDFD
jgi:hypothetical protein